jgi:DNA-binding MarR family transcriptional regulator
VTRDGEADFRQTVPFTMHRVTALAVSQAEAEFGACGVSIQGARVLVVVLQNPGIRISDLAAITCIELSTLSHMLRRFERDGLIARARPSNDNRTVLITLTPRGRDIAVPVHAIVKSHQDLMLAGIPQRDITVFRRVLARMAANVEAAATNEPSSRTLGKSSTGRNGDST